MKLEYFLLHQFEMFLNSTKIMLIFFFNLGTGFGDIISVNFASEYRTCLVTQKNLEILKDETT
jgi:hypothetical protein